MLPFGIGLGEVLLILVVILLVVGPRKLPDMAKTVGKGLRTVRKAGRELRDAVDMDDMRQQVYQPIRQWEQQQRIEEAQFEADLRAEAEQETAAKAKADEHAERARLEKIEQDRVDKTNALLDAPPDPATLHTTPTLPDDAAEAEDAADDGPVIVARTPGSVYKKPRPLGPEDDGQDA